LRGEAFHGARRRAQSALCGPIGLRQDEGDFVPCIEQRSERALGELRRTGKNEAQEFRARPGRDA